MASRVVAIIMGAAVLAAILLPLGAVWSASDGLVRPTSDDWNHLNMALSNYFRSMSLTGPMVSFTPPLDKVNGNGHISAGTFRIPGNYKRYEVHSCLVLCLLVAVFWCTSLLLD